MKADEGRTLTDAELEKLEEQIIEAYGDAAGEMQAIIDEYFEKFAALDEEYKALIGQTVNGEEWTEERYQQWRLAQLGRGERFNLMRDRLNERVTAANETAMAYINDATPGIYTLNRNYAAYEVGGTGDFALLDEQTVRRLVAEQPDLMPYYPEEKAVRRGIDLEYGKKQITNSVTRGILTGRSSHEIAADLLTRVQDMSVTSAIRAARTAVTAAENGGRQASYEKAAAMGIEMEREWMATKDARTRPEHGAADGQRVAVDEPFIVGGQRLMTPGDTAHGASGWNIYNCRCCVRAVVKGHGRKRETYAEWLEKQKRLENSAEYDNIMLRKASDSAFNSSADPMADAFGAGEDSNPEEIRSFRSELDELGVDLVEHDTESLGYCPGLRAGQQGTVYISHGASYSAWCHEMQHVRDDAATGWQGMRIIADVDERYAMEERAYNVEIELALKLNRPDIADKLRENLEKERRTIYGE